MWLLLGLALVVGSLARKTEHFEIGISCNGPGGPPTCNLNGKRIFAAAEANFFPPAFRVEGGGSFWTLYIKSYRGAELWCTREGSADENELFEVRTVLGQAIGEEISSQLTSNGYPPLEITVDLTDKGRAEEEAPGRLLKLEIWKRDNNVDIECRVGVDLILDEDYGTMDELPSKRVRDANQVRGLDWEVVFEAKLDAVVVCRGADLCKASRKVYRDEKGFVETRCDDGRGRSLFSFTVELVGTPQPVTPLARGEHRYKFRLNSHAWGRGLPIECVEKLGRGEVDVIYDSSTKRCSEKVSDMKQPDTSRPTWYEFILVAKPEAKIICSSGHESLAIRLDFTGHQKWYEPTEVKDFNVLVSKC